MIFNNNQSILTVSQLTLDIKVLLEENFPFIWLTGEISNFHVPASKHFYFTLKDENAQISSIMFRGQNRNLKFVPEDGMRVTGLGRISLYEPRGTYQIIFEYLEPKGIGQLQVAFEQLKANLAAQGFFDEKYKKNIPFLPEKVSVITSSTGAVIHDIIKVVNRRFSNMHIELVPVKVQGCGSDQEIADAVKLINERMNTDVIILARGGGSLEDFQSFNSEIVAKAIFESKIPVISGVGHETDVTIADFVADLRAPTPSAAAELAVPVKDELKHKCLLTSMKLEREFNNYIEQKQKYLTNITSRLVHPKKRIQNLQLRIDDYTSRLIRQFTNITKQHKKHFLWQKEKFLVNKPLSQVNKQREKLDLFSNNMLFYFKIMLNIKFSKIQELTSRLHSLNPDSILARGYSITRALPDYEIVKNAADVLKNQKVEVKFAKGSILCSIEGILKNGSKTDI